MAALLAESIVVEPNDLVNDPKAMLAIRAIIGMADDLLRETYARANPRLAQVAQDEESVADVLSAIWYRAFFVRQPPPGVARVLPAGNPEQGATCSQINVNDHDI